MSSVIFVLVGTRSPGNLGAVCRVAKAFGFPAVRLVAPRFTAGNEEAVRLAHGAEDVLERVETFETLRDAQRGCFRTVATTARPRDWSRRVLDPEELVLSRPAARAPLGVVFGPEDRGLTNEDLAACDEVVSIPLPPDPAATLSLPAAAAILAWELSRGRGETAERPAGRSDRSEAGARRLEATELAELEGEIASTLDEIGFRPRPNATRFSGSLRDFLARAETTAGDRLLLRHVFAQVGKWRRRLEGELRERSS